MLNSLNFCNSNDSNISKRHQATQIRVTKYFFKYIRVDGKERRDEWCRDHDESYIHSVVFHLSKKIIYLFIFYIFVYLLIFLIFKGILKKNLDTPNINTLRKYNICEKNY